MMYVFVMKYFDFSMLFIEAVDGSEKDNKLYRQTIIGDQTMNDG